MGDNANIGWDNKLWVVVAVVIVDIFYVQHNTGMDNYSLDTRGQDYKEKHKTRLKTYVKRTVLNNTKLRHFWAQIVSWAPIHARKTFIILAPALGLYLCGCVSIHVTSNV